MILTKAELIASLQNEVRILLHLASKVDRHHLEYRPTAKQRSVLELLRYLSYMGPELLSAAKAGAFDPAHWTAVQNAAAARDFDATVGAIAAQSEEYARLLDDMSDDDFRTNVTVFGRTSSRGAFIVNNVLCGCAAYRTQLFLYLKACGREELNTMNLWAGMDPTPVPA
ncbi:MAG: hypothetical protein IT184_03815 [Acidobacteria bacterium]|nr:hypothetical protein [Acidobacteriota bacterium]